jgi:hypothetical protein
MKGTAGFSGFFLWLNIIYRRKPIHFWTQSMAAKVPYSLPIFCWPFSTSLPHHHQCFPCHKYGWLAKAEAKCVSLFISPLEETLT